MTPLKKIEAWLKCSLRDESGLKFYDGHWSTYDYDDQRYVSYQLIGGRAPRADGTRTASVLVTVVGAKTNGSHGRLAETNAIMAISDKLMTATEQPPASCKIVSVTALGDVNGPIETDGGRYVVGLTLEMIF